MPKPCKAHTSRNTVVVEAEQEAGLLEDAAGQPSSTTNHAVPVAASKKSRKPKGATTAAVPQYFTDEELEKVRQSLLQWYDANHRVLPWRRTPCSTRTLAAPSGPHEAAEPAPAHLEAQQFAYMVWVSEIMLQQTQVVTVMPYFQKWIAKWPTVKELAAADIEQVNVMWAGLGYYRRARYLLDGAKYVIEKLDGKFPTTAAQMLSIPGVGPYTAAAVASIAFNDPSAVVDGNVIRVVSRIRALPGDPTALTQTHSAMAQQLLDTSRPGDFNQAVMELGARICKPVNPECTACPASSICSAYKEWQDYVAAGGCPDVEDAPKVTRFPGKKAVKAKKEMMHAVCVLEVVEHKDGTQSKPQGRPASDTSKSTPQALDATAQPDQPASRKPGKRQASMLDFMASRHTKATKVSDGKDASAAANLIKDSTRCNEHTKECSAACEEQHANGIPSLNVIARLLAAQRKVLLVQRPEGGLLAGLWELPSVELEEEVSYSQRQSLINQRVEKLLGPKVHIPGISSGQPAECQDVVKAAVVRRHDAGSYVHIFSHIRQTNFIERLVLLVQDMNSFIHATAATSMCYDQERAGSPSGQDALPENSACSVSKQKVKRKSMASKEQSDMPMVTRWIIADSLQKEGISSGPLKMYEQATGESTSINGKKSKK